jgi:hypothetical protein
MQYGRYRLTFKGSLLPPLPGYTMMLGAVRFLETSILIGQIFTTLEPFKVSRIS